MAKRKTKTDQKVPLDFKREKEAMLAAISAAIRTKSFSSLEEAQSFLDQFTGRKMSDITAELVGENHQWTQQERAEDLFFEAMEARTIAACRKKLNKVLQINPGHVRALTALAGFEQKPEEVEKGLRRAIAAGEQNLGRLLEKERGHLWGIIEARPYMEARGALAEFLGSQAERLEEAISEHQEMLRLNENDNQGMRDPLLGMLLEARRFKEARALVKRYDTQFAATWMYAKALLEFQHHAEQAGWDTSRHDIRWLEKQLTLVALGRAQEIPIAVHEADEALIKALEFNPWGAIHIMKAYEFSDTQLPEHYAPGSKEEARLLLEYQGAAWMKNPSALFWLMIVGMPWLKKHGFEGELEPG